MIGTCSKEINKRDKIFATTPLTRNKQVTFKDTCETSTNNTHTHTHTHVRQQKEQKTNVPVVPSTRVISSTAASGSKPRSETKNNRTLPAKSVNQKKVDAHPRNNKSSLKKANRVDSSISFKRAVINLNSDATCKTCNDCLISGNHDDCVVSFLMSKKRSPVNVLATLSQKTVFGKKLERFSPM